MKLMKKIMSMIIMMALLLSGCSQKSTSHESTKKETTALTASVTLDEGKAGSELFSQDGMTITFNEASYNRADQEYLLTFTLKNDTDMALTYQFDDTKADDKSVDAASVINDIEAHQEAELTFSVSEIDLASDADLEGEDEEASDNDESEAESETELTDEEKNNLIDAKNFKKMTTVLTIFEVESGLDRVKLTLDFKNSLFKK